MTCRRCNRPCPGTMMRTDKRYSRVRTMLETEAPRDAEGRFELCHACQRSAYFANGFFALLIRDIHEIARMGGTRDHWRFVPRAQP